MTETAAELRACKERAAAAERTAQRLKAVHAEEADARERQQLAEREEWREIAERRVVEASESAAARVRSARGQTTGGRGIHATAARSRRDSSAAAYVH